MLIPDPAHVADHLMSASDPVERALLCSAVAGRFADLQSLALTYRRMAMLEAYEGHGWSVRQLAEALGITPARVLTVVTEAKRARGLAGGETEASA